MAKNNCHYRRAGHNYERAQEKALTPKIIKEECQIEAQLEADSWSDEDSNLSAFDLNNKTYPIDIECFPKGDCLALPDDDFNHAILPDFESSWNKEEIYDPRDGGIGYLRWMMEGVSPNNIAKQNIDWVVAKYTCLSASTVGGLFSKKMPSDARGLSLLVKYSLALEDELTKYGLSFTVLEGLSDEGWETYKAMKNQDAFAET